MENFRLMNRRELLGEWIKAQENNNKALENLIMDIMIETQSSKQKELSYPKRKFKVNGSK